MAWMVPPSPALALLMLLASTAAPSKASILVASRPSTWRRRMSTIERMPINPSARAESISSVSKLRLVSTRSDIWNRYSGIVSISTFTTTENAATAIRLVRATERQTASGLRTATASRASRRSEDWLGSGLLRVSTATMLAPAIERHRAIRGDRLEWPYLRHPEPVLAAAHHQRLPAPQRRGSIRCQPKTRRFAEVDRK